MRTATCAAPTNIAVVKYWGKADAALNTPLNSSVSVTLDAALLAATTTVASNPGFSATRLWLNGEECPVPNRALSVLSALRAIAPDQSLARQHVHIVSENSFPTAAGLASSAAGYACLVKALAELWGIKEQFPGQLSVVARMGSGSASRSLQGGFVRWNKGEREDGSDSLAEQIASEAHWPELCAVVCVVSDQAKDTSSTSGMQTTAATSELLRYRTRHVVPERVERMEAAYLARDFATFAKLTMQDSNQFHATCLDTYPPIMYLSDVSRAIIRLVHRFNGDGVRAAYTFDAGPNAVLFLERQHLQELLSLLLHCFPSSTGVHVKTTLPVDAVAKAPRGWEDVAIVRDCVKMFYVSGVGGGATVLPPEQSLMDEATGQPLRVSHRSSSLQPWMVGASAVAVVSAAAFAVWKR